jgi:hypothetical protein
MTITLSTDVGRALTPAELDANFQFVDAEARAQKSQADSSASAAGTSAAQALSAAQASAATAAAQTISNVLSAFGSAVANNSALLQWAYANAFRVVTATRDANGAIVTALIVWPDGATGVFTTDVVSTLFPGAVDAWHATYINGTTTHTVAQPAVTRDANGAVIAQPAITIT